MYCLAVAHLYRGLVTSQCSLSKHVCISVCVLKWECCKSACMRMCTYTCVSALVFTCTHMHVCVCVREQACMHVRAYVRAWIHLQEHVRALMHERVAASAQMSKANSYNEQFLHLRPPPHKVHWNVILAENAIAEKNLILKVLDKVVKNKNLYSVKYWTLIDNEMIIILWKFEQSPFHGF